MTDSLDEFTESDRPAGDLPAEARTLDRDDVQLLKQAAEGCARLRQEIGKVIVGQDDAIRALLAAIFAEGHVLIVGVPGLAKTLLVKTVSQVLSWKFHRIQFTPDMMPADIIGMELLQTDASGQRSMKFVPGPVFANIILADEINRTPPKTQSALLEAMQERTVTSMGRAHSLERPFVVVATQNPIEQEGTYPLPEAQLDRFMFSLWIEYPPVEDEERIVMETTTDRQIDLRPVFTREQLIEFQSLVRRVPVSKHIVSYAVAIARSTRPGGPAASDLAQRYVEWGAGPRAGQQMVLAGKALAVIEGSPAVTAEHIRQAAPLVLRHRILPNYQATGEGVTVVSMVDQILKTISEPQYK